MSVLTSIVWYVYVCVCVCQETIEFDDWCILSLSVWLDVHVHLCVWINFLIHFRSHRDVVPSVSHAAKATLNHLGNEIVSTHHRTDGQMTKIRSDLKELIVGSVSAHICMHKHARAHTRCGEGELMVSQSHSLCLKITQINPPTNIPFHLGVPPMPLLSLTVLL